MPELKKLKAYCNQFALYSLVMGAITFIVSMWIMPGVKFSFPWWKVLILVGLIGGEVFLFIHFIKRLVKSKAEEKQYVFLVPLLGILYVSFFWLFGFDSIQSIDFPFPIYLKLIFIVSLVLSTIGFILSIVSFHFLLEDGPAQTIVIKSTNDNPNKVVIEVSKKATLRDAWKDFWNKFDISNWKFYAIFLTVLAIAYFSSALFSNLWTVPLGGDYTQQTIPFYTNGYDDWWHFITTGEFPLWDSSTNLGVNNIGSNAFYYALNPFFLPILIFPRSLIPQGIACLMIAKLVLAAFAMKKYLVYMGVKKENALFFAMAYAFCGWNTYYLWFNHFMEITVLFPLVFLGIEKILRERKPWMLMTWLGVLGVANYFFLVSTSILGVIYAVFRYFQLFKTYTTKEKFLVMGIGFAGFFVAIMISSISLLPGIYISAGSDRVTNATYLSVILDAFKTKDWATFFNYLNNWEAQSPSYVYKKFYPLITFFFPTLSDRSSALLNTSNYDNTVSSLFIYTPLMLMVIPSLITSFKEKKVSHIVALVLIVWAIFTPFSYNALHGFTKEYGRWQLFVSFVLITYVALNYEKHQQWKGWYYDASFLLITTGALLTYIWAYNYQGEAFFQMIDERIYDAYYEFAAIVIVYLIYRFAHKDLNLTKYLTAFTAVEVIIMGTATMFNHGFVSYQYNVGGGTSAVRQETSIIDHINKEDDTFFRVFNSNAYKGNDNVGMRENYNGLGAFHSLYNFNLMEFNSWSHVNYNYNGWSMGLHEKRYNLDMFLGVKYYMVQNSVSTISYVTADGTETFRLEAPYDNVPYGYSHLEDYDTKDYRLYRNDNFVELGSSFDTLMRSNYLPSTDPEGKKISNFYSGQPQEVVRNEEMYLNYGILDTDDYDEVLSAYPEFSTANYYYAPKNGTTLFASRSGTLGLDYYGCSDRLPFEDISLLPSSCSLLPQATSMNPGNNGIYISRTDGQPITSSAGELIVQLSYNYSARIFLYGINNELITFDTHGGSLGTSFKAMRALYSPVGVQSILIMPMSKWTTVPTSAYIFSINNAQMENQFTQYRENGFESITHSYNKYAFDTNYMSTRFAVTNVAYDTGWSVKIVDDEDNVITPKVYRAQGGFVGFVIPSGSNHITISYFTPYLGIGLILSSFGLLLAGGSYGIYCLFEKKRGQKLTFKTRETPVGH
ncbi:MAG TPA: YfhO family protein [Bacilli bacterium]|nr:YfhO family protein [Bacilli bacterium]